MYLCKCTYGLMMQFIKKNVEEMVEEIIHFLNKNQNLSTDM